MLDLDRDQKARKLAAAIAHHIFETGVVPEWGAGGRPHRIAFKGTNAAGAEADLGGLNENALADVIYRGLTGVRQ